MYHNDFDFKRCKEKKKEIWLSPMTTPTLIPTENSKTKGQYTNATKNFDYTTIADRTGRSIGATTVIQLVWLNRFTGTQPSH